MTDPFIPQHFETYFLHLDPWIGSYRDKSFCFLGIQRGEVVELVSANLWLRHSQQLRAFQFRLGNLVAGTIPLSAFQRSGRELVEALAAGEAVSQKSTGDRFVFPVSAQSGLHVPPPQLQVPEAMQTGRRVAILSVLGADIPAELVRPEITWELRAATTPYDSLSELLGSLELPGNLGGRCRLEVIATSPIEVSMSSTVDGGTAKLGLWLPKGMRIDRAKINYLVRDKGRVVARKSISGRDLFWQPSGVDRVGMKEVEIPVGALLQCVAIYAGQAHHSYWLVDPRHFQNPRLSAYESVDTSMTLLRSYLLPAPPYKGHVQSQFETAVCWMLWLMGFSQVHMGLADQAKDGPDAIVVAPNGSMAIVECTIGLLKEDSKLAKLARRAIVVKDRLVAAGFVATPVLPLLVTSLPRAEVAAELEAATEQGILVLTRENLEAALQVDIVGFPDGDRAFKRAIENLTAAQNEILKKKGGGSGELFPSSFSSSLG